MTNPPVCDYEGSDYQQSFWDKGEREYEDRAEAIALGRLLPKAGRLLLEVGAGAGRNTPRYAGFEHIVLLDYSMTQLQQARRRLGDGGRYTFVAGDVYRLPFQAGRFDAATMIRTLHHMAEPRRALEQVRAALEPGAVFILEFANKQNLKAIGRYWLGRQAWSPFTLEPAEFAKLNFDFHPRAVRAWLQENHLTIEATRAVSHFRFGLAKRLIPARFLAALDGLLQPTGGVAQLTPSIFIRSRVESGGNTAPAQDDGRPFAPANLFKCPVCGNAPLEERASSLRCAGCGSDWGIQDGIFDFRHPK